MNRYWNLSGWSLVYFAVLLLSVLDLFDVIDLPWFLWWPMVAVAVWGALSKWGRLDDARRDGRSVPNSDKHL